MATAPTKKNWGKAREKFLVREGTRDILDQLITKNSTETLDKNRQKCREFIEIVLKTKLPEDLDEALADGVILCNLLQEGFDVKMGKVYSGKLKFKTIENIRQFLQACTTLNVPNNYLFQPFELSDKKDMRKVYDCVLSLHRMFNSRRSSVITSPRGDLKGAQPLSTKDQVHQAVAQVEIKAVPVEVKSEPVSEAKSQPQSEVKSHPQPQAETQPDVKSEVKTEPQPEVKPEPQHETKPEPHHETKPEPHHETKPEPHHETKPEPHETKPEPHHETKPEPHHETKPEPHHETKPEPHHETKPEPHHETKPEPHHETKPEPHHETKPEPHHETKPEPEHEAKPEPQHETKPEPEHETKPEPSPEVKHESTPQSIPDVKPEPTPEAEVRHEARPQPTPKVEAEHEASPPTVEVKHEPAHEVIHGSESVPEHAEVKSEPQLAVKTESDPNVKAESEESQDIEPQELVPIGDSSIHEYDFIWESKQEIEGRIYVIGSFSYWELPFEMEKKPSESPDQHVYCATVPLQSGEYQYKFLISQKWHYSPSQPIVVEGSFVNNYIEILTPQQQAKRKQVTFTWKESGSGRLQDIYVIGTFSNWWAKFPLNFVSETNGEGVYSTDLLVEPGEHQFKFIRDGEWVLAPGLEVVSDAQFTNHYLVVE